VTLAPGEKRTVRFPLGDAELGFYDSKMRWTVEPGAFKVWVSNSSEGGLTGEFRL